MKQLTKFFMLAALATFVFTSCGDDDEDTGLSLEGTVWVETSYASTNCDDPADNESGTSSCTSNECYTILLSGGVFTNTEIEGGVTETTTGSYTITGNTIKVSITIDGITATVDITFSISGNTLTITFDDPFDNCKNTVTYQPQS